MDIDCTNKNIRVGKIVPRKRTGGAERTEEEALSSQEKGEAKEDGDGQEAIRRQNTSAAVTDEAETKQEQSREQQKQKQKFHGHI